MDHVGATAADHLVQSLCFSPSGVVENLVSQGFLRLLAHAAEI
jgi:hypothetical protein